MKSVSMSTRALALFFLLGCQATLHPTDRVQGTGDGGGCNGVQNACYDSYAVDPTALDAYKEHLTSLMMKITQSAFPTDDKTRDAFATIIQSKTWYLLPMKLKTLPKERLGLEFSDDQTEQFAIQTSAEVWIDSNLFGQMNPKDQAQLLLHEVVMSVFLLKYKKFSDLCRIQPS
ncbi:MAG: hypothetical protein EOP06_30575 [Proteobacteria bacterium]|nr:MAG: hypothetical protein EOP06_30575 [Pseudomonadota bacterium]